jgi:tetratricopeptide (TPR) repeat protein
MKNFTAIVATVATVLALTASPTLHAAPADAEAAKAHSDRGMMYYNLSDWPAAIREFRAAFEADPRPDYLFSKAQAEKHRGDYTAAILSYKAFLRTSDASPARVAATESLIKDCETKLDEARKADARREDEQRSAREDKSRQILSSAPAVKVVAAAPVHKSWATDATGLVLFIGGLGVGAAGTTFFFLGNTEMHNAANQATYQQYESNVSEAKTKRLWGIVGMSTGGCLLAASIVRFALVASRSSREEGVVAYLDLGPASVGVRGRF